MRDEMITNNLLLRCSSAVVLGLAVTMVLFMFGCESEDNALPPYEGRPMATITVEQNTFAPKVTWLGGYASAFGVNRDTVARLDSSLIWLIRIAGNVLHYPVTFGQTPSGAEDLTASFGGTRLNRLIEDRTYTYWVLKDDAWGEVSKHPGKPIALDPTDSASPVQFRNDTIFVSSSSFTILTNRLDVYANIKDFKAFGRLAKLNVVASDTSDRPWISWTITQTDVSDTLVAAIGVCAGGMYDVNLRVWEAVSQVITPPDTTYFKHNVIKAPMQMGDTFANTYVSVPFEGLLRGQDYYLWIAAKDWNGEERTRSTRFYAFANFKVW